MWKFVDNNLMVFKECFSREKAFKWFVVVIVGLMVREDRLGITSIVRTLEINPGYYETLIHFFRANSWELNIIRDRWIRVVWNSGLVYRINGTPLLIGDGVKQSKEGRKMPCVKKLAQESENSGKPQYIHGHMFGAIGILIGTPLKWFCTLISLRLHDGNEVIGKWAGDELSEDSHVVRMIREAYYIASLTCHSLLALDRYFLTVPALEALNKCAENYCSELICMVTKAKSNATVFTKPIARYGRGRPRKKGGKVKLFSYFESESDAFNETKVNMYGEEKTVKYLVKDLLWGKGLYQELRFVLVKYDNTKAVLVSTDLNLLPETIIEIYALRFKIESVFRETKQVIAGFAYHFWSLFMPKLNRFEKNSKMTERLETIKAEHEKNAIVRAFKAIEGFAMFSAIAMGIIQMCSLRFAKTIDASPFRWLRTKTNVVPSEATTVVYMQKTIFQMLCFQPNLNISRFIREAQIPDKPD
jgi:hypothetical protein